MSDLKHFSDGTEAQHKIHGYKGKIVGTTKIKRLFEDPNNTEEYRIKISENEIRIVSPANLIPLSRHRKQSRVKGIIVKQKESNNTRLDLLYCQKKWLKYISAIPKDIQEKVKSVLAKSYYKKYENILKLRDFCFIYLYYFKGLSGPEIKEKYRHLSISCKGRYLSERHIQRLLREKYGVTRSHNESMSHRIKTGRMDYSNRKVKQNFYGKKRRRQSAVKDLYAFKNPIYKNYLYAVGLNSYLTKSGKTKEELAKYLEVRRITISRWASLGHRVSLPFAELIAKFFSTTVDQIFRNNTSNKGLLEFNPAKKEYFLDVKRIYDETGNIKETAKRMDKSVSKIYQTLKKGKELNLF